ncbi:MAG: hypothetical protein ACR2RV_07535 [Verrucomicrobiales bacterium]
MKTSFLPLVLIVAVAVLAVGNLIQYRSNQQLRERVSALEGGGAAAPEGGAAGDLGSAAGATGSGAGSAGAGRSGADAEKLAGIKVREKRSGEGEGETFSSLAERYAKSVQDNPAIQKQMLAQFEAQLGDVLEGLYDHFELEGEELSHFKGLIAEHWRVQSQVPMQLMSAMGDAEKVQSIKENLEKSRDETDARIAEFLNDDGDYAYYETYRDQLPDRMEVNQYRDAMDSGGVPLTADQEAQLVTAMAEERESSGLGDLNDPLQWDMEDFNEESVAMVMDQMGDFHSRVQVRAGGILEQEQVSALADSQNDIRQQQELGMRFGLQMMEAMHPKGSAEGAGGEGADK